MVALLSRAKLVSSTSSLLRGELVGRINNRIIRRQQGLCLWPKFDVLVFLQQTRAVQKRTFLGVDYWMVTSTGQKNILAIEDSIGTGGEERVQFNGENYCY